MTCTTLTKIGTVLKRPNSVCAVVSDISEFIQTTASVLLLSSKKLSTDFFGCWFVVTTERTKREDEQESLDGEGGGRRAMRRYCDQPGQAGGKMVFGFRPPVGMTNLFVTFRFNYRASE